MRRRKHPGDLSTVCRSSYVHRSGLHNRSGGLPEVMPLTIFYGGYLGPAGTRHQKVAHLRNGSGLHHLRPIFAEVVPLAIRHVFALLRGWIARLGISCRPRRRLRRIGIINIRAINVRIARVGTVEIGVTTIRNNRVVPIIGVCIPAVEPIGRPISPRPETESEVEKVPASAVVIAITVASAPVPATAVPSAPISTEAPASKASAKGSTPGSTPIPATIAASEATSVPAMEPAAVAAVESTATVEASTAAMETTPTMTAAALRHGARSSRNDQ